MRLVYKILIPIFLIFLYLFMISFANSFMCARITSYEIITSQETGSFIFNKNLNFPILSMNKSTYSDLKIFFDDKELQDFGKVDSNKSSDSYFYSLEEYVSKKVDVRILDNDDEIYSAEWTIKDTSYSTSEKIFLILFLMFSIITIIIGGLTIFEKVKVRWLIISVLINIILYTLAIPCFL